MLNLTTEQVLDVAKTVAPVVLSAVGTVFTALTALVGWALRRAWRTHNRRMSTLAKTLEALSSAVNGNRQSHEEEDQKLRDGLISLKTELALTLNSLRNEIAHVSARIDGATKGVAGVEAVCRLQQDLLQKTNESLALTNGKLVAIFRFIEAPKRATDTADET